jgi:hypothetical protein
MPPMEIAVALKLPSIFSNSVLLILFPLVCPIFHIVIP